MKREKFEAPIAVELTAEVIARAKTFANAVARTIDYRDSNQRNVEKIKFDHFISKLGEEAAKHVFENRNALVEGPDYNIYEAKQKTWQSDLIVNGHHVAVKTQTKSNARKYGLSWTFQQSEIRKDPILKNPEAWVCFVECDEANNYKCTVYPPARIKDLNFQPPRLQHLIGKKQVVYASDLKKKLR